MVDLGNTVLAKRAANDLHAIKAKKAPGFRKPALFQKVMALLEAHHFRLPICRFVIDLFDKDVLKRIVLDEEDEADEEKANNFAAESQDNASEDRDSDSDDGIDDKASDQG